LATLSYRARPAGICFLRGITSGRETNPTATEKKILSAFFFFAFLPFFKKVGSLWITTGFIGLLRIENREIEDVIPS